MVRCAWPSPACRAGIKIPPVFRGLVPHAGLAPTPLRDSGAHPPADRRRWLCDKVSGLYATTQWGCAAGMWLKLGGIKHGHAHTGYMIAAGYCADPAAAKEETRKAVCLTIPWYQYKPFPYHILSPVFQLLFCDTGRCADTCNASPPRSPPTAGRGCTVDAGFHGRAGWRPG